MIKHRVVDETTWPVDMAPPDEDSAQWVQRYGTSERVIEQRMAVASVLGAYSYLTNPRLPQADAIAALKRARKAAASPDTTEGGEP